MTTLPEQAPVHTAANNNSSIIGTTQSPQLSEYPFSHSAVPLYPMLPNADVKLQSTTSYSHIVVLPLTLTQPHGLSLSLTRRRTLTRLSTLPTPTINYQLRVTTPNDPATHPRRYCFSQSRIIAPRHPFIPIQSQLQQSRLQIPSQGQNSNSAPETRCNTRITSYADPQLPQNAPGAAQTKLRNAECEMGA